LGLLAQDGYRLVPNPQQADLVIVNTCAFLDASREESYGVIREMAELKRSGRLKGLIVSGCLAEREQDAVRDKVPEVDALIGVFGREQVTSVADRLIGGLVEQRTVFRPAPSRPLPDTDRLRVTPRHFAYLKISEGCNRRCTFCAIPKMRGKHATKPMEEVVAEAQQLAADGVRELILVAQDLTYYGLDLYGRPRLAELIRELEKVEGIEWIRCLYLYPMYFTDELIEVLAKSKKVLPYLDMPLQHIADDVLRRMQRRVNRARTEELLGKLRSSIPHLTMRTTFITGFPGETERDFEELEDFIAEQRFERLGVFTYSPEPGTPGIDLPDQIPTEVKEERRERLMLLQQQIAFEWNESQIGRKIDVIIDGPDPAGIKNRWMGRGPADTPDIDGLVYVTGKKLAAGQIVRCEITAADGYDLLGEAVGKPR
jgi:ribosomal protein S12 methylthiotransferase